MVTEQQRRLRAGQMTHSCRHATLKLVVVVGVEQVVFAVVLVVHHQVDTRQAAREGVACVAAVVVLAVGVAAPVEVGGGEVGVLIPVATIDQSLQSGAVGPGAGAENAVPGVATGGFDGHAFGDQRRGFARDAGANRVYVLGLVKLGKGLHGGVKQANDVGEGVAEETGNTQRDVDARAVEQ